MQHIFNENILLCSHTMITLKKISTNTYCYLTCIHVPISPLVPMPCISGCVLVPESNQVKLNFKTQQSWVGLYAQISSVLFKIQIWLLNKDPPNLIKEDVYFCQIWSLRDEVDWDWKKTAVLLSICGFYLWGQDSCSSTIIMLGREEKRVYPFKGIPGWCTYHLAPVSLARK